MDKDAVLTVIRQCLKEINQQLPEELQVSDSPETVLVGNGGILDSLSLINLLVLLEDRAELDLGVSLSLVDEEIMTRDDGPYRTVASLAEWIASQV